MDVTGITTFFTALLDALLKARPSAAKGRYLKKIAISLTMGPSVRMVPEGNRNHADATLTGLRGFAEIFWDSPAGLRGVNG